MNLGSFLEASKKENILMGILLGMKKDEPDEEVKLFAVKAFNDSLNFMENFFKFQVKYLEKKKKNSYFIYI